ncbi:MAG: hypothetical protein DHS20C03_10630 [Minwuia thermotolerans]|nr:MAG: hypothetical protein DHS20C03_10630 [Minwuia thermotolerans]
MTVPYRLLQPCTGLLLGLAMLFLTSAAQAQKVLDPYQIKRTVLSSDGRYMVFDFHKLGADEKTRTRYSVAVYDMATESIELHIAPPPREFHSASFSPDDRFLAVIQHCWAQECRPEELGLNVGVIDRENRSFQLVTNDGEVVYDRRFPKRLGGARKVRGFPTFDPASGRIYFGYRHEAAVARPGGKWRMPQILNFYGKSANHLGYVEFEDGKQVERKLDLQEKIDGRSSFAYLTATPKGIYAHMGTPNEDPFLSHGLWGGIIDPLKGSYSPLFPDPPYFKGPRLSQSNYRTDSLRASHDGRSFVFREHTTDAAGNYDRTHLKFALYVGRDGKIVDQFRPPRGYGPSEVAVTGDGRMATMTAFNDSRIFWWIDLETRRVTEKPLRAPLEAAIARTRH